MSGAGMSGNLLGLVTAADSPDTRPPNKQNNGTREQIMQSDTREQPNCLLGAIDREKRDSDISPASVRVLIACECSGTVRRAFESRGFDAWSCDVKPDEHGSNRHFSADVLDVLTNPLIYGTWDLVIVAHPPCTRLCASGVRWLSEPPENPPSSCVGDEAERWATMSRDERHALMWEHLDRGAALFSDILNAGTAKRIAVENPVMHGHAKERIDFSRVTSNFYVQPWHFATSTDSPDYEKKRTGFWTIGLPALKRTGTIDDETGKRARDSVHKASPGADRNTERSRFFPGMARAIAEQWGDIALNDAAAAA